MSESVDIVWLRDDFRLDDQPAIYAAAKQPTLFVYIHDDPAAGASARRARSCGLPSERAESEFS